MTSQNMLKTHFTKVNFEYDTDVLQSKVSINNLTTTSLQFGKFACDIICGYLALKGNQANLSVLFSLDIICFKV